MRFRHERSRTLQPPKKHGFPRGFSLAELVVAIGIIVLLLGLVVPAGVMLWRAALSLKHQIGK